MNNQTVDLLALGITVVPDPKPSIARPIAQITQVSAAIQVPVGQITQTPVAQIDAPLSGALRMIALGVPVAPVAAGKKFPPMTGFPDSATTNREQVMRWAAERPG